MIFSLRNWKRGVLRGLVKKSARLSSVGTLKRANSPCLILSTTLYQSREKYFVLEDCFPSDIAIAAALSSPTMIVKSLFELRRGVGTSVSMSQISTSKFLSQAFSLPHNTTAMDSASAEDSATRVEQEDFQSTGLPKNIENWPRVDIPFRASINDESTHALTSGTFVFDLLGWPFTNSVSEKLESDNSCLWKIRPSPGNFFRYPKIRRICTHNFSEGHAMYCAHRCTAGKIIGCEIFAAHHKHPIAS